MVYLIPLQAGLAPGIGMLVLFIFLFWIFISVLIKQITRSKGMKRTKPGARDYVFSFLETLAYSILLVCMGAFLFYEFVEIIFWNTDL